MRAIQQTRTSFTKPASLILPFIFGLSFGLSDAAAGLRLSANGACGENGIETTVHMVNAHCRSMGGVVVYDTGWGWGDCRLDMCEDGDYAMAGANECHNEEHGRDGYGIVYTTAKDCRAIGGAMGGNPADHQWTGCHLDICEEGVLEFDSPGLDNQRAYGIVLTNREDCESLKGGMNPNFDHTRHCHLGLVDAIEPENTIKSKTYIFNEVGDAVHFVNEDDAEDTVICRRSGAGDAWSGYTAQCPSYESPRVFSGAVSFKNIPDNYTLDLSRSRRTGWRQFQGNDITQIVELEGLRAPSPVDNFFKTYRQATTVITMGTSADENPNFNPGCPLGFEALASAPSRSVLNAKQVIRFDMNGGPVWCENQSTKSCDEPQSIANGRIIKENENRVGSRLTYICDEGYAISALSQNSRTCGANGKWTGDEIPTCTPTGDDFDTYVFSLTEAPGVDQLARAQLVGRNGHVVTCHQSENPYGFQVGCDDGGLFGRIAITNLPERMNILGLGAGHDIDAIVALEGFDMNVTRTSGDGHKRVEVDVRGGNDHFIPTCPEFDKAGVESAYVELRTDAENSTCR